MTIDNHIEVNLTCKHVNPILHLNGKVVQCPLVSYSLLTYVQLIHLRESTKRYFENGLESAF